MYKMMYKMRQKMLKGNLTDKIISQTINKDQQNIMILDGDGLYLHISRNRRASWVLRYVSCTLKKVRHMGLGPYPVVSIIEARNLKNNAKFLNLKGIDPIDNRKARKKNVTIKLIYKKWAEQKLSKYPSFIKIQPLLEKYLINKIKNMEVANINAKIVADILLAVEKKQGIFVTVKKICQNFNQMMNFAVNFGYISSNPCSNIALCLNTARSVHFPAIPYTELSQLFKALGKAALKDVSLHLFIWSMLTAVRPKEACSAMWQEIDIKKKCGASRPTR